MAFMQCSFHSDSLGMECSMNVIVPQPSTTVVARKDYRVLYLLHGCSDDHTTWGRRTSIERYVAGQDLVVVMPAAGRSFYTDMVSGGKYWTFISEELPKICQALFPVSTRREDTFVAGLSMGGYGTLKLLLNKPEQYMGGAAFSAATDARCFNEICPDEFKCIYGSEEQLSGSINDLFAMAAKLAAASGPKPKIFQCCGTEDMLYRDNVRFRDFVKTTSLDCEYREYPGGHNWEFWDRHIMEGLEAIGAVTRN